MAKLHIIYDPTNRLRSDAPDLPKSIKVAVLDIPDNPAEIEKLGKEVAIKIVSWFHQPDV